MRLTAISAIALVFLLQTANATPSCMTQDEARVKFPRAHLYWHGPKHCWTTCARPPRCLAAAQAHDRGNDRRHARARGSRAQAGNLLLAASDHVRHNIRAVLNPRLWRRFALVLRRRVEPVDGVQHAATAWLLVPIILIELAIGDVFAGLLDGRAGPTIGRGKRPCNGSRCRCISRNRKSSFPIANQ